MSQVAIAAITFDRDCQTRVRLDEETLAEYAHRMKEGAAFPPITVFFDGSTHWLADGFHRFAAWKTLARERGDEATATVPAEMRQGTRLDAVRHALSANALHGKRREPGDYIKAYQIAVRAGLCEAYDTEAVCALLACSERWARDLTAAARAVAERERNARIVQARERGETQAKIAARECVSQPRVAQIEREHKERRTAETYSLPVPRPLPPQIAALDRPSLGAWSDAAYALEKLIEAMEHARRFPVPRKGMPKVVSLIAQAQALLTIKLEAEDDAA